MQVHITLGISYLASGGLVILFCLPLLKDKIGPNPFYGVRIKKAYQSRENWFKLQRFGGRQLIIYGAGLMLLGTIALCVPFAPNQSMEVSVFALAPLWLILIPVIQIFRYAKTL